MLASEDNIARKSDKSLISNKMMGRISRITQRSKMWAVGAYLVLFIFFILVVFTFQNYGITYDEYWRSTYGEMIIKWYKTGFQYKEVLTYWNFYYYGGFSDVVQQLATKFSPLGIFETRHLINALFGLLAMLGVYKLGKILATPFVGFLSVLFLLINPRFYGHSFNNPLDVPSAAFYILSLYFLSLLVINYPKLSKRILIYLGIALGLALSVRISSVIILGYIGIAFGLLLINQYFLKSNNGLNIRDLFISIRKILGWSFLIGCLAYLVMLIWWPAAQVNPLRQPYRSLKYFSSFEYPFNVLFDGQSILNTELPWYYQIKWFLITMPEFMLVALGIGLVIVFIRNTNVQKLRSSLADSRNIGIITLFLSILLPLGYTTIQKPTDYDGIRHFLFIVPPLCVAAALSIGKLFQYSRIQILKYGLLSIILASMILTIVDMVKLHPDEYIYFNRLFGGGVAEASKKFDTDYWGNSYKEAVEWVEKNYPVPAGSPKVKVASCLFSLSTSYYLRDDRFEYIGSYHDGQIAKEVPDLFLASKRWNCDQKNKGEVIHEISRMGAPLVMIMKVTK